MGAPLAVQERQKKMNSKTTVDNVMTTDPQTVSEDTNLSEAARLMSELDVGAMIVTANDGTVRGLITDRDIVVRAIAADKEPSKTKVSDVCTRDPIHVAPEDTISDAVKLMAKNSIRRIPVVSDGSPVGILSLGDLAATQDPESVLASISAAPANN